MQQQTFSTEDEQTIGEPSWQEVDEDLTIQSIDPSTGHQQGQKTLHDAGTRAHWQRVRSLQRKREKDIAIIAVAAAAAAVVVVVVVVAHKPLS